MAFKWSTAANGADSPATIPYTKTAETALAKGDLLAWDVANNGLERATASTDTLTAEAIAYDAAVIADVECVAVPLTPGQFWEVDTTSNTAAGQVGQRAILTDEATINNTGSDDANKEAIVRIVRVIGAASEKKALVKIIGVPGQVVS